MITEKIGSKAPQQNCTQNTSILLSGFISISNMGGGGSVKCPQSLRKWKKRDISISAKSLSSTDYDRAEQNWPKALIMQRLAANSSVSVRLFSFPQTTVLVEP